MPSSNLFENTATLYDLDTRGLETHDTNFYLRYARRTPGEILELACGTGRVTIKLAENGHSVTGIDLSPHMLDVFREKLRKTPQPVRRRIRIRKAPMSSFKLGRRFPLIIIPFRAFQALTTEAEISGCLSSVARHLAPGGIFILDVFVPYRYLNPDWADGVERVEWVYRDPETGTEIRRADRRTGIEPHAQIISSEIVYYIRTRDGAEKRVSDPIRLKYYLRAQIEAVLASFGYTIEEEFGEYDGRPIGTGREQIFVCRRREHDADTRL